MKSLNRRVSSKLEEGGFKGTIGLASSDDRLAYYNSDTFTDLQDEYPAPHPDTAIPPPC